ncbi:MAG: class I SAM-dependent methyltransferase [Chloroflexota bacterium]
MDLSEVRQRVVERGCFERAENERIYRKFFATVPRSFLQIVERHRLGEKRVVDVGCGYGHYLIHFGPTSLGLDANEKSRLFALSIGLQVLDCNVEDSLPLEPESFDAVWCANLLEHLVAPHLLLSRLHRALTPDGLLVAKVPVIPPWFVRKGVGLLGRPLGFEASEHINAFTPATFAFTVERAGFQLVEQTSIVLGNPLLQAATSPITRQIGASITVVARKDPAFVYPEKRLEAFDPSWMEASHRGETMQ